MIKLLFPFGAVELDEGIEEEAWDELSRSILYLEKYMGVHAA